MRNKSKYGILVGLVLLSGSLSTFFLYQAFKPPLREDTQRHSDNPTQEFPAGDVSWKQLTTLLGQPSLDLAALRQLAAQSETREQNPGPKAYLKAMLAFAQGNLDQAVREFQTVRADEIPITLLYFPYRICLESQSDGATNAFQTRILEELRQDRLPSLTKARVLTSTGRLNEALGAYMETDPSTWRTFDINNFTRIAAHAGLRQDLRRFIQGAISAQRVLPEIATSLSSLLTEAPSPIGPEGLERLRTAIQTDQPSAELAIAAYNTSLKNRTDFLAKRYQQLVDEFRDIEVIKVSNELALMLFLSALRVDDSHEATRWGQEIKRRQPNPEVTNWIESLKEDRSPE